MQKKYIFIYLLLFVSHSSSLIGNSFIQDGGSWNKLKIKGKIPHLEKIKYWIEPNMRLIFNKNIFLESVNHIALGYHFEEHKTIWQGYTINPFQTLSGRFGLEHRVWQQLYLGFYPTNFLHVASRTRLEARWINLESGTSWRLRQRMLFKFKHCLLEPLRPVIFDELFFNLSHPRWVSDSEINQNRAFVGFDYYFSKHNYVRIGYMNRFTTSRFEDNLMLHLIWIAVHLNFH